MEYVTGLNKRYALDYSLYPTITHFSPFARNFFVFYPALQLWIRMFSSATQIAFFLFNHPMLLLLFDYEGIPSCLLLQPKNVHQTQSAPIYSSPSRLRFHWPSRPQHFILVYMEQKVGRQRHDGTDIPRIPYVNTHGRCRS